MPRALRSSGVRSRSVFSACFILSRRSSTASLLNSAMTDCLPFQRWGPIISSVKPPLTWCYACKPHLLFSGRWNRPLQSHLHRLPRRSQRLLNIEYHFAKRVHATPYNRFRLRFPRKMNHIHHKFETVRLSRTLTSFAALFEFCQSRSVNLRAKPLH